MTQYVINIGTVPNDGTGDPLRTAFNEVNLNFDQVFEAGPVGSNVQIANNTILTTNTNGNLVLAPNGIGVVQANVNIVPNTSNTRNLGSSSRRWSELYVQYANISGGLVVTDLTATGNVTVAGNLSVSGNIINVANIITDAKTIQLANTAGTANAADGSGITVGANDAIATFLFNSANTVWATNIGVQVGGPITGTSLAVSDAIIYGNTTGINALFTGTVTTPNIVVNNITSDDSTFVTIQDGLDVNGDIETENITVNGTITSGNIVPRANVTYSLGNSTNWWSNVWVAGNTIYIGGVPLGMSAGNVLTVNGNAVLQNDSNTTISTTGNITADYFFGNGSQLTGLNTSSISNGNSNVDIPVANGNINITSSGTYNWTFDDTGNVTFPPNGQIIMDNGDGTIGNQSDDLVISWDNEEIRMVSVQGSIEMQADNAFRVQTNYDGANVLYASRWEFSNNELVNISNNFGIVSEAGNLTLSGGRDGVNSGNTIISAVNLGNAVYNWNFGNDGNLNLPSEGNIVGVTPNNAGRLQWVGNSSGDGFGYTTLGLIPDDTLVGNDQYLIIDPTAPGHIHIRAGGAQDNSNADLFLGGENSYFKVNAGSNNEVRISANSWPWTFGADGTFTLPANAGLNGSKINSVANSSGDGAGYTTLQLIPDVTVGTGTDQYLIIDPTAPGHIHIRAGGTQDASSADLFLGGENSYFKVASGANAEVQVTSNSNTWVFNTDGNLQVPGNINGDNNAPLRIDGASSGEGFISLPNTSFGGEQIAIVNKFSIGNGIRLETNGGNLFFDNSADLSVTGNITGNYFIGNGSQLTGLPAQYGDANVATFLAAYGSNTISTTGNITAGNFIGSGSNVDLVAGSYDWTFVNDGNLVLPGNTFAVKYANGTAVSLAGTYGDSNVTTLLGNLGSNTVSTTGNVTSGNLFTSGTVSATGAVNANSITVTSSGTAVNASSGNILTNQVTGTQFNFLSGLYTVSLNASGATANYTINWPANAGSNGQVLTTDGTGDLTWTSPAGSYGNSNVATFLGAYGSNTISTTGNITAGNLIGNISITGNVTGTSANVTLIAGSYSWTFDNTGNLVLPANTFAVNYANGTAVTLGGTYGNANVADFLDSLGSNAVSTTGNVTGGNINTAGLISATGNITGGNIVTAGAITATGNVTANTFIGNISLTGNIQGTSANVELVAGSYTWTFDNTGYFTIPAIGGDEGGEIHFGIPAANTTLTAPVKVDVYQDRIRFFDGSTKGAYIDMAQTGAGVSTLLNNRVSAYVNAGTFVTMDNLTVTVTTSGNRGLSVAAVSGSFSAFITGSYVNYIGGVGGSGTSQSVTTSPSTSLLGYNFTSQGDLATYIINDTTNSRTYRVTLMIGGSYNNNMIAIERLI